MVFDVDILVTIIAVVTAGLMQAPEIRPKA
jgi:hypothetical protein